MGETRQPHLLLSREEACEYAVLPGDPQRVDRIAEYLTDVRCLHYNREFKSISGFYKGVKILCVSTGIGGVSMGIALEELHNIGVHTAIRVGSCGALQKNIRLGELILAEAAVRDDGTSRIYMELPYPGIADARLLFDLMETAEKLGIPVHTGIIRSHDSFYTDREEEISAYWSEKGILGADQETAALFVIGKLRKMRCASILNNVVCYGTDTAEGIGSYAQGESATGSGEQKEILLAHETLAKEAN